jgi:hypothetical protein
MNANITQTQLRDSISRQLGKGVGGGTRRHLQLPGPMCRRYSQQQQSHVPHCTAHCRGKICGSGIHGPDHHFLRSFSQSLSSCRYFVLPCGMQHNSCSRGKWVRRRGGGGGERERDKEEAQGGGGGGGRGGGGGVVVVVGEGGGGGGGGGVVVVGEGGGGGGERT